MLFLAPPNTKLGLHWWSQSQIIWLLSHRAQLLLAIHYGFGGGAGVGGGDGGCGCGLWLKWWLCWWFGSCGGGLVFDFVCRFDFG